MLIRLKRFIYCTPLRPHVYRCHSGRMYQWDGTNEGIVEIPYREDVEDLLADEERRYATAYERYGITWDAQGRSVPRPAAAWGLLAGAMDSTNQHPTSSDAAHPPAPITGGVVEAPTRKGKKGR